MGAVTFRAAAHNGTRDIHIVGDHVVLPGAANAHTLRYPGITGTAQLLTDAGLEEYLRKLPSIAAGRYEVIG